MDTNIDALRAQLESVQIEAQIAEIQAAKRAMDTVNRLVEAEWGEPINRREYLYDSPGFYSDSTDSRISRPDDRRDGKNYPFFENEQDLANIRGIARHLSTTYETGVCISENLVNYTVGTGMGIDAVAKKGALVSPELVRHVSGLIADWQEAAGWYGGLEQEIVRRRDRDGESLLWIRSTPQGPRLRIVDPEFVTEPSDPRAVESYIDQPGLSWSFGVASAPNNPADVMGYFVQWYGDGHDWDYIPAQEMHHIKANVDTGVKRGLSDFYAAYRTLEQAAKVLTNTAQGAAIQAAIAYIKESTAGTSQSALELALAGRTDKTVSITRPKGGTDNLHLSKVRPGTIINTAGNKYHAGPLGQPSAPIYIEVIQAALRVVGARWCMPEYMISGDASNAAYASTMVAGGPFDRAIKSRQAVFARTFRSVFWKVIDWYAAKGEFREYGIRAGRDLRGIVEIDVQGEPAAMGDKRESFEIDKGLFDAGVMSPATLADRYGLDYESEQKKGAKKDEPQQPGLPGLPGLNDLQLGEAVEPKDGDGDGMIDDGKATERAAGKSGFDYNAASDKDVLAKHGLRSYGAAADKKIADQLRFIQSQTDPIAMKSLKTTIRDTPGDTERNKIKAALRAAIDERVAAKTGRAEGTGGGKLKNAAKEPQAEKPKGRITIDRSESERDFHQYNWYDDEGSLFIQNLSIEAGRDESGRVWYRWEQSQDGSPITSGEWMKTQGEAKQAAIQHAIKDSNTNSRAKSSSIAGDDDYTPEDLEDLVGLLPGGKIEVSKSADRVNIRVQHPKYTASRTIKGDVIKNNRFFVKKDYQGRGIGLEVFSNQVEAARRFGFRKIELTAGKGDGMNGYYTWARMGFDAELEYVPKEFPKAKRVSDLMKTERGRDWWLKNGEQIDMDFDLEDDSISMKVLNRYRRSKGLALVESAILDKSNPDSGMEHFDPLPSGDDALLDSIWDNLDAPTTESTDTRDRLSEAARLLWGDYPAAPSTETAD